MKSLKSYRNMTKTILKEIMMTTVAMQLPIIVAAQEAIDTIAPQELHEIVVQAPKVIRKADMEVYHPSK
ncbi:MAG: hypothetical protein K2H08_10555, partial [Duncaniella sp.]|nr:hypothetical protein [Duncaniella sp.]